MGNITDPLKSAVIPLPRAGPHLPSWSGVLIIPICYNYISDEIHLEIVWHQSLLPQKAGESDYALKEFWQLGFWSFGEQEGSIRG